MSAAAWVFLAAWAFTSLLLLIAVGGNANLVKENRRLRRAVARLHPSRSSIHGGAA